MCKRWFFSCFYEHLSQSSAKLLISHLYDAVTSRRHVMTSQNLIYAITGGGCARKWITTPPPWIFSLPWVRKFSNNISFVWLWRFDVMSWRHRNLPISACRCERKLFFICFMRSLEFKSRSNTFLHDALTWWRPVMTSQDLIYEVWACRCARKMILTIVSRLLGHLVQICWKNFSRMMLWRSWRHVITHKTWFSHHSHSCASKLILLLSPWLVSQSSQMLIIGVEFLTCSDKVMTSCQRQNLSHLSQLYESWPFLKMVFRSKFTFVYWFFLVVMLWRHVNMSWQTWSWCH